MSRDDNFSAKCSLKCTDGRTDKLLRSGVALKSISYFNKIHGFIEQKLLFRILSGMQAEVIRDAAPWGLPLELKIMPQHFKDLGYQVNMIGKVIRSNNQYFLLCE